MVQAEIYKGPDLSGTPEKPPTTQEVYAESLSWGLSLHHALLEGQEQELTLPYANGAMHVVTWMAELVAAKSPERRLPEVDLPPFQPNHGLYYDILMEAVEASAQQADIPSLRRSLRQDPTGVSVLKTRLQQLKAAPHIHPAEIAGASSGVSRVTARYQPLLPRR